MAAMAYEDAGQGRVKFAVDLAPAASMVAFVTKSGKPGAASTPQYADLKVSHWQIKADTPNVLVLDYCDYKVNARL
jgi:hypothetical protein